jgi:hypothetical protein
MEITREMWIGAGALAFVGAVVLMVPPTIPVAPVATSVRPHARSAASPSVNAPAFTDYAAATGGGSGAPVSTPSPGNLAPPAIEREPEMAARDTDSVPSPRWRDAPSVAAEDEDRDSPDPDFTMGYRWAEQNGVFERRDCRRWRGSPAEDGCRAYLRDADGDDEGTGADM